MYIPGNKWTQGIIFLTLDMYVDSFRTDLPENSVFSHLLLSQLFSTKKKEITFNHPIAYLSYFPKTQSLLKASDKMTLNNAISKKVNVFKD